MHIIVCYRWEECTASHFNKVASTAYKEISDEYKQHLMESSGPRIQQMSRKSIMKCGEAFKNIQKEVYTHVHDMHDL